MLLCADAGCCFLSLSHMQAHVYSLTENPEKSLFIQETGQCILMNIWKE